MHYRIKWSRIYWCIFCLLATINSSAFASNCPIIFLHGHSSGWKYWYSTPPDTEKHHVDYTAMKKILDEAYHGYTPGQPLNCFENTNLTPTGGNTRKIYNFQYYHPDPNQQAGWSKDIPGAIGSNGYCYPVNYYGEIAYRNALSGGSWAQALSDFIDKVLEATGATKVDIVAHSIGSLVARAAIKWYGCASKVRKLLMIATPNHGILGPSPWSNWSQIGIPGWMQAGENQEMDGGVLFYKTSAPNVKKTWTEFLNEGDWAQGVEYVTISGNLDPYILPSNEDGIVDHEWVVLNGASFNAFNIYAAHGSSEGNWLRFPTKGELSLTACTYTTEFIKNWMIDDDVSHNGASVYGSFTVYDSIPIIEKYYHNKFLNSIGNLHWGVQCLSLYIDTAYSKNPRGDKTGVIVVEFLGASIGQAVFGLGVPYLMTKTTMSDDAVGSVIESSIKFLILYSVGAPIGATTGCLITAKRLSEPDKSFGAVFKGALIGEAIGWGAQFMMAHIGKESFIFFFIPVSVGAVVAYNKNDVPSRNLENNNNTNKHIDYSDSNNDHHPQKINMELFNIKF